MISAGLATAGELATVLSVEDIHDLAEIASVDAHNRRILAKRADQPKG